MREMVNAASKVVFHNHDLPNDYYYGKFKPKQQRDNLEKVLECSRKYFRINIVTGISWNNAIYSQLSLHRSLRGERPGPKVIKLYSCSTQLTTKFQLLMKLKYQQIKKFLALNLSNVVFIMQINVKMPTIVGILTFIIWDLICDHDLTN